jgi:subtilisin family serine protease
MEYIVMRHGKTRRSGAVKRGTVAGKGSTRSGPVLFGKAGAIGDLGIDFDIKLETVEKADLKDLKRDDTVSDFFPTIPLSLIAPTESSLVAPDAQALKVAKKAGSTWGVRAVKADTSSFTGKGVKVAVLDTGIDKNHVAFEGVTIEGENFLVSEKSKDRKNFHDEHGHGTHCAGTIFGRAVDGLRIGVAPGVEEVYIGKVIGPGSTTGTLMNAMNWAIENGVHVISMSLGFDFVQLRDDLLSEGHHPKEATWVAMKALIDNVRYFDSFGIHVSEFGPAFARNPLIVAASGNESDREGKRFRGAAYEIGAAFPSAAKGFLSIAAVGESGTKSRPYVVADFSNSGAELAGPGVDILSAAANAEPNSLRLDSGTSMATPHVAGVAALWAEKFMKRGEVATKKVYDSLRESAVVFPGLEEGDVGRGIPQAPQK